MRKELYVALCDKLKEVSGGVIRHIDLWNHNVEFIEQEDGWERPAVFIEFCPIEWKPIARGREYRAEPFVKLHIVTDWEGSASSDSPHREDTISIFDLSKDIHRAIGGMHGETFQRFDLVESQTSHNHEDIVENIEVYSCVAFRRL